ncbi:MAG: elongation factor Ts [Patescibacteria group bacterium]|nr:elongation factor Ts [Patescibacteria group bacterium]
MENLELLKQLREETGISMIECKKALQEAKGDLKRAKEILREKGKESIKGREGRPAQKGLVESYIHAGSRVGVLLQLNCESDFVARSADFRVLAHEICLHIAAAKPLVVKPEDISSDVLQEEKRIAQKQFSESGKPQNIMEKIIEGRLQKYKEEVSLLSQPWVKDQTKKISDLIVEARAKLGENIEVGRFARYEI